MHLKVMFMNNRKLLSTILLTTTLALGASAQTRKGAGTAASAQPGKAAAEATPATTFDQKRFDELRAQGFDALYNLDYDGARRRFTEITKVFPDHPAGYQFIAVGLWLKTLNESRRLQASLYNQEGFYKEKDDAVDPKVADEFRELTRKA